MRNSVLSFVVTVAFAAIALVVSASSQAHPGGLDKNGCHHDTKTGDYHCHQGPNAGKSFASQEAMEQGGRGVQMKSESSSRDEAKPRREKTQDNEPVKSTKSRKQKAADADADKQDETAESPKRAKTKEKAYSDTPSKKTSTRKKAKTAADEADDAGAKKTKKTTKKNKAEKSDASAADKDAKPKKTKKKKSSSKDEAAKQE